MRRRVVINGIGAITPIGNSIEEMWKAQQEAKCGISTITHFDASRFPTTFAGEVKGFQLDKYVADTTPFQFSGKNIHYALGAARQAYDDSGLSDSDLDPGRLGVYLGAGEGQQDFLMIMSIIAQAQNTATGEVDLEVFTREGLARMHPQKEMEQEPNMTAGHLAAVFNAQGPNLNCLTACAASSQAIGEATEIIRRGDADAMISGGAHSMIHPLE